MPIAAAPPNCCASPPSADALKKRAGACVRMAPASGQHHPFRYPRRRRAAYRLCQGHARLTDRKRAEEAVMLQLGSAPALQSGHPQVARSHFRQHPRDDSARPATLALYDAANGEVASPIPGGRAPGSARRRAARSRRITGRTSLSHPRAALLDRLQDSSFPPRLHRHLTGLGMQSGCWVPLIHRSASSEPSPWPAT